MNSLSSSVSPVKLTPAVRNLLIALRDGAEIKRHWQSWHPYQFQGKRIAAATIDFCMAYGRKYIIEDRRTFGLTNYDVLVITAEGRAALESEANHA